jgi:hypothetical protein
MVCSGLLGLLGFSTTALSSLAGYDVRNTLRSMHDSPSGRASVIGLYVSYATPIFLRITSGRRRLARGPFSLGRWYLPIGAIAVSWVTFIVVVLLFPASSSVEPATMSEW